MEEATLRLNIGAGNEIIEGFKSVDLYMPADIKDDITKLSTIEDNSIDEVLTYHLLEHLRNDDVLPAMQSVFRVLKPGKQWKIEVPNLMWLFDDFINTPDHERWGWKIQTIFGLQNHEGEYHRTGFSVQRLKSMLESVGFVKVEVCSSFSEKYNQEIIDAVAVKP